MRREWDYESNPKWLEARKGLLTATEIADLIGVYDDWKNPKAKDPDKKYQDFVKACRCLWAKKNSDIVTKQFDSPEARRGHCLEKECVDSINDYLGTDYWHLWDDVVVSNDGFGASPDALDIPMPEKAIENCIIDIDEIKPRYGLEIKSLGPEAHEFRYQLDDKDKWRIDEGVKPKGSNTKYISQIIAQMAVMNLESVTIVFFNPASKVGHCFKMFIFYRSEMEEHIKKFFEVRDEYMKLVKEFESFGRSEVQPLHTERELYDMWLYDSEEVECGQSVSTDA